MEEITIKLIVIIILIALGLSTYNNAVSTEIVITIKSKQTQQNIKKDNTEYRYLVHSAQETFVVESNLLKLTFNNSERFFQLEENKTYKATVTGIGKTFFTDYRNIIKFTEINNQ
jgi:hypothetical protein